MRKNLNTEKKLEVVLEKFFCAFPTHIRAVPYIEVTVLATDRYSAKEVARKVVAPLGLKQGEVC